jgi:Flp pilus assembly pilin Flp
MRQVVELILLDESGQDLTEYAILLALVAVVVISALEVFGPSLRDMWLGISGDMEAL